jgi:uncharacterized protein (TIGR02246 family)
MRAYARYGIALVAALSLAACAAPPAATGTADDEAAIRAIGPKFADAWTKGDVAAMSAMTADDYQAVNPDGTVIKGRAAAEENSNKEADARAGLGLKLTVDTTYVRWVSATAAEAGGTWAVAGAPAGSGPDKGAWMTLDVKGADGQWRTATGLVAAYVPPPAPPAATPMPAAKGKGGK